MKIILTHGYFIDEDPKEREIMRPYPPLGILYVSAWLEKYGYDNHVFDSTFSSMKKLQSYLLLERPDILAVYTNLMTKVNVVKLLSFMKSEPSLKHCKLVLGGPEVRNHAERFLKSGADFLVLGEGEQTMLELTELLHQKADFRAIPGIAYLNENNLVINPERVQLRDLSQLPLPNRTKINLQLYFDAWKDKHGSSAISINTMRGCPYTCKWCSRAVYGLSYRRRSPKEVVDEIEWIQKTYNVDTAWFVDDVFTVNHKWLREFNGELKKRKVKLPYECITRADRMTEEVIDLLKESGCFRVWIGAESGSQRVIDLMDRRVDVEKVREMIVLSQQKGVQAGTFIMVGYPGETEEDIMETVHHLKASNPDIFTITVAYPIKGTDLYSEVEADFTESLDWATSTDRDIDFKRTYSRKYYDYAVRMIVNDVNSYKASLSRDYWRFTKHKTKAVAARVAMQLTR
jgi:anaerobic magnesium-protoporphyrin IX monomethyl ester cyclase